MDNEFICDFVNKNLQSTIESIIKEQNVDYSNIFRQLTLFGCIKNPIKINPTNVQKIVYEKCPLRIMLIIPFRTLHKYLHDCKIIISIVEYIYGKPHSA